MAVPPDAGRDDVIALLAKIRDDRNLLEEKTDGRRRSSGSDDPFKNYVDISDKGFVGGMIASFVAGTQGKGVITAWDKQTWYKPKGRRY